MSRLFIPLFLFYDVCMQGSATASDQGCILETGKNHVGCCLQVQVAVDVIYVRPRPSNARQADLGSDQLAGDRRRLLWCMLVRMENNSSPSEYQPRTRVHTAKKKNILPSNLNFRQVASYEAYQSPIMASGQEYDSMSLPKSSF